MCYKKKKKKKKKKNSNCPATSMLVFDMLSPLSKADNDQHLTNLINMGKYIRAVVTKTRLLKF